MRRLSAAATVVTFVLLGTANDSQAFPSWLNDFTGKYSSATRLDTCGTCHTNFQSVGALNPYGQAFNDADGPNDPAAAFTAIESADSDGDGTSNIDEINQDTGFHPGWTCETYGSATNPPADLADYVEPLNVGCVAATTTTLGATTTVPASTTTTLGGTTTTVPVTTTIGGTTTTVPPEPVCSQPVTGGSEPGPKASDCLFILRTAVGSSTCEPACICNTSGSGGTTASDALICLKKAVGQDIELNCLCGSSTTLATSTTTPSTTATTVLPTTTTVTLPPTTTTSTTTTTTGGGSIANGTADYDARCSFCHAAGSHDTEAEFASDLAGDGDKLVPDLGTIDAGMDGILLDPQELLDMEAFLDSLN
jgi:hypothetical protein